MTSCTPVRWADRASFILQHVVDAHAAQSATAETKPMTLVFALVGLYLHVERQFSGSDVQRVHARLARQKRPWPVIRLPSGRGSMTAGDVLASPPGPSRDAAISAWCRSVWAAFYDSRETVVALLSSPGIVS